MAGALAILASFLAFIIPLAVPLLAQRSRSFIVVLLLAAGFFAWLNWDIQRAGNDGHWIGPFLGGLMLFGFAAGAIAKFVMLVGRRSGPPDA